MDEHLLRKLFPNASPDLLLRNGGENAIAQRNPRNGPLAKKKNERSTGPRFLVRVQSIRKRLGDEDGLCPKFHIDLLRYSGVIPDDAPGICKIEASQRKAEKGEQERTVIEVFEIIRQDEKKEG